MWTYQLLLQDGLMMVTCAVWVDDEASVMRDPVQGILLVRQ